jgi:hypothetical protein
MHHSYLLLAASRFPGLVGTVGIRMFFADFHGFHKPHQQKRPPSELVSIDFVPVFFIAAGPVGNCE